MGSTGIEADNESLAQIHAYLQAGQKIFLQNDHPPKWLHDKANWPGQHHLAYVEESINADTNQFKVQWHRNGNVESMTYTLESPTQVKKNVDKLTVQVEDDANSNIHTAKIVDLLIGHDGSEGKCLIKWDTGHQQFINLSQIFIGLKKRQRRATRPMVPASSNRALPTNCDRKKKDPKRISSEKTKKPIAKSYIGQRVSRVFSGKVYGATVSKYDPQHQFWAINHDDGDAEELDFDELCAAVKLHQERKNINVQDDGEGVDSDDASSGRKRTLQELISSEVEESVAPKGKSNVGKPAKKKPKASHDAQSSAAIVRTRSGRVRKPIIHEYMHSDWLSGASSEESEEHNPKHRATRAKRGRATAAKKRSSTPNSDEDEFSDVASVESEEFLVVEEEEEPEPKKRVNRGSKSKAKPSKTKPSKINPTKESEGVVKKNMAESFAPMDNPPYYRESLADIKKKYQPLDPCGVEATDNIIEGIVGKQLDCIGGLLTRSLRSGDCDLGSAASPLKIATACSGTDAPVLAITLLKEQMDLRKSQLGIDDDKDAGSLLHTEHVFSCEIEGFKQAYIARQFEADLYPDICNLCDQTPRDAWGRPVPLGDFNLAVMGTSCKNFSTERTKHRLDIEDKGCSGETFLAAVELIFKKKPKYAILENVEKAPWEKMKEYVTGRVRISNCSSSKQVKEVTAQEKKMDLGFVLLKGKIVVDKVPGVYGVRSGSELRAVLKGDSSEEHDVAFPDAPQCRKEKRCTLKQLMEYNGISKSNDTLVFDTGGATFCAHYIKVDTKQYGLPQTRNRVYMFVWQPDDGNANDDLGEYWEAVVRHLQMQARHSLGAFLLQDDHDSIRTVREAYRGPPGRISKRAQFLEPYFWDSSNANLKYSKIARERSGIDEMARALTSWGAYGAKQVPPHYWLEFVDMYQQRSIDMLDVLHASAARDVESHDSCHSSFFWNISQNIGKEKHRGAVAGVAGCVTPGGIFFLPNLGRPLLGCEKLLLQGIPYFRLLLGNETEVQLGDLAGNAMSLTVISAAQIGVLTAKQLRSECMKSSSRPDQVLKHNAGLPTTSLQERLDKDIDLTAWQEADKVKLPGLKCVFEELLPLAKEAVETSIRCTCETSGRNSDNTDFVRCSVCGVSCCRDCMHSTSGYQLKGHSTESISLDQREAPGTFQSKLQSLVPTAVVFGEDGIRELSLEFRAKDLDKFTFGLHRIFRGRNFWCIVYYARADGGSGEPIAEFTINVGEVEARGTCKGNTRVGVAGRLRSFLPTKLPPIVYGPMVPCAKVVILSEDDEFLWMHKTKSKKTDLIVKGFRSTPSFRAELGINDDAKEHIDATARSKHKKGAVDAAKSRGEERRFFYPDNWKEWPEVIDVSGGGAAALVLHGHYERAACRQTINQSALWIRKATDSGPALYLMIQPNVSRNGPDCAVFTSSIDHSDLSSVVARLSWKWQPCDALRSGLHTVAGVEVMSWSPLTSLQCYIPSSDIKISSPKKPSPGLLLEISGLSQMDVQMLSRNDATANDSMKCAQLNVHRGQGAQQTIRVFNSICVTPIQQYAAKGLLQYDLAPDSKWIGYTLNQDEVVGCDDAIFPRRPAEHWAFDAERQVWRRRFGPEESRQYFIALSTAPRTFNMALEMSEMKLTIDCYPQIAVHRAARNLIEGRGDDRAMSKELVVHYRLCDSTKQIDPSLHPFHVSNCESLDPTSVSLKKPYELYDRQQKALTKMGQIEDQAAMFGELEMFEDNMPGSTGWSLIATASRTRAVRGGVIADAIGAGKTVISIALILRGLEKARASRRALNQSSATIVVVPPGLIDQWAREIIKFTSSLNIVSIYDLNSLKNTTAKEFREADVVICPVDILESKGYFDHLLEMAGDDTTVAPNMPRNAGQAENQEAKGVWVSASSRDPYGGKYCKGDQRARNESAYYTYVYNSGIEKLRKKVYSEVTTGVPLEYFYYERVIVDEIHESLCTTKGELKYAEEAAKENDITGFFKEKNRRAGRELLGITERNVSRRPLRFRRAIFGLTGTPLLDSCNRVIELANLMGGTYIIGLSSHWRKLERESMRDIFLQHYLEPSQGREYRRNMYSKGQEFINVACCRNKTGEEMEGIKLVENRTTIRMTEDEGKLYLSSMSGIPTKDRSFAIQPADFDVSAGHDITKFLRQNAKIKCRGRALVDLCKEILTKHSTTKIIVFADGAIGGGVAAREFLSSEDELGCTWLDSTDSIQEKNRKISWYQSADVTSEDRARPRVLVLNFEHAAGLNLQSECNNLILFTPLYVGEGGTTGDAVADASTELQAIGRVYRPGQVKQEVNVYRIEVRSPADEECLDGQIIRRNTDKETIAMAVNAAD